MLICVCLRILASSRISDMILGDKPLISDVVLSHLSQAPVSGRLLGLSDPYHRHTIGTFHTCSQVPIPRSLTDASGCYHIENLRIATTLSPPFSSEGSTDPP
jgi:hypothetical protein